MASKCRQRKKKTAAEAVVSLVKKSHTLVNGRVREEIFSGKGEFFSTVTASSNISCETMEPLSRLTAKVHNIYSRGSRSHRDNKSMERAIPTKRKKKKKPN